MRTCSVLMLGLGVLALGCSSPANDTSGTGGSTATERTGGSSGRSSGGSGGSNTGTGGSSAGSGGSGDTAGTGGSSAAGSGGSSAAGTSGSESGGSGGSSAGDDGGTASDAGAADDGGMPSGNPATPGAGLHKIFDGTTLNGWTSIPAGMFNVANGALVASGKGRGAFATNEKYTHFRILFSLKPGGTGKHQPTVLVFCNSPDKDAMGGIQLQPPNGGTWDYRPGKNNAGKGLFTKVGPPGPAVDGWFQCEVVANAMTGEAKMACGGKDVVHFKDPTAGMGMAAPFAIQTHNAGISDSYKDLSAEDNITDDNYTTVK